MFLRDTGHGVRTDGDGSWFARPVRQQPRSCCVHAASVAGPEPSAAGMEGGEASSAWSHQAAMRELRHLLGSLSPGRTVHSVDTTDCSLVLLEQGQDTTDAL